MKKKIFTGYRTFFLSFLLILILGAVIYSNSFSAPFIYDDIRIIVDNQSLRQPLKSLAFLSEENSNRPLLMFTFALNYAVGGLNVRGYHIVNILFHALNAILIFIIAGMTLNLIAGDNKEDEKSKYIFFSSLSGALFFLCSPLATESVTYISSRSSVLSTTFFLAALSLFIRGSDSEKYSATYYFFSILSFFTAMGFKETALIFPAIVFLYDIFFFKDRARGKIYYFYLPLFFSVLILIAARLSFILTLSSPDETGRSIVSHFLTELELIPFFFWESLMPFNLNIDHDFLIISSPFSRRILIALLSWFIMLLAVVKSYRYSRFFSFSILWFIICVSPHLLIRLHDLFAERWLYLSMAGTGFLMASVLYLLSDKKYFRKIIILISAVILLYSLATYDRNKVYGNTITLWQDAVKKSPHKARPHNNYGFALQNSGFTEKAAEEYLSALKIAPDYIEAHNNIGAVYGEMGFFEKAEKEFKRAIELNERSPRTYNNLGMLYQNKGLLDLAISEYKKAIGYESDFAEAHNNLGLAYYSKGMPEEAMKECKTAISLQEDFPEAYHNLGLCFEASGMTEDAVKSYESALSINPNLAFTHIQLGRIFLKAGLKEKALMHFKAALRVEPQWDELRELIQELE